VMLSTSSLNSRAGTWTKIRGRYSEGERRISRQGAGSTNPDSRTMTGCLSAALPRSILRRPAPRRVVDPVNLDADQPSCAMSTGSINR
jgi:hypothetical protein